MLDKNLLEPAISLFAECHTCLQTFSVGAEKCPHCGIKIYYEEVFPSIFNKFVITQAISSANSIHHSDAAVFLLLGGNLIGYLGGHALWFISNILLMLTGLCICLRWFSKHGRWESKDVEYAEARQKMKKSLTRWILANLFAILLICVSYKDELPFFR